MFLFKSFASCNYYLSLIIKKMAKYAKVNSNLNKIKKMLKTFNEKGYKF